MIYFENQKNDDGIKIETKLGLLFEIALAKKMSTKIKNDIFYTRNDLIDNLNIDYRGINITAGIVGCDGGSCSLDMLTRVITCLDQVIPGKCKNLDYDAMVGLLSEWQNVRIEICFLNFAIITSGKITIHIEE
jgi:hypothetical protein